MGPPFIVDNEVLVLPRRDICPRDFGTPEGTEVLNLAPKARFELATARLTAGGSTAELPGNKVFQ
jgi:hypothetical protein